MPVVRPISRDSSIMEGSPITLIERLRIDVGGTQLSISLRIVDQVEL